MYSHLWTELAAGIGFHQPKRNNKLAIIQSLMTGAAVFLSQREKTPVVIKQTQN